LFPHLCLPWLALCLCQCLPSSAPASSLPPPPPPVHTLTSPSSVLLPLAASDILPHPAPPRLSPTESGPGPGTCRPGRGWNSRFPGEWGSGRSGTQWGP
jgi:hypothetical protein